MSMDPRLAAIVVCPACRSALRETGGTGGSGAELACTGCDLRYPVRDEIPVLLLDEARRSSDGR